MMLKDDTDECKCCTMIFDRVNGGNFDVLATAEKVNRWALACLSEGQELKLCRRHFEAVSVLKHEARRALKNAGLRNA